MPIKGKLHLHFAGVQQFLLVHYLFELINLFEVHVIDLRIGAIPAGPPPAALISSYFATKLIYTQTPDHRSRLIEDNHVILEKLCSDRF
jgi:hypothetical protein